MSTIKSVFTRSAIARLTETSAEAGKLATAINSGIKSRREALAAKKLLKSEITEKGIESPAAVAVAELMNDFTPAVKAVRTHLKKLKDADELGTPEFDEWLEHGDELKATIDGLRKYFGSISHTGAVFSLQTVKKADATETVPAGSYIWATETTQNKPLTMPATIDTPASTATPTQTGGDTTASVPAEGKTSSVTASGQGNNNNRPQHETEAGQIAGDVVEFENPAEVIMAALDMMDRGQRVATMVSLLLHLKDAERTEVVAQTGKRLGSVTDKSKAA